MTIIESDEKVRLIKRKVDDRYKYSVQALTGFLWWKKWRTVCFGPYYPMTVGISSFFTEAIARNLYKKCLPGGEYREPAFHYLRGVLYGD